MHAYPTFVSNYGGNRPVGSLIIGRAHSEIFSKIIPWPNRAVQINREVNDSRRVSAVNIYLPVTHRHIYRGE